MSRTLLSRAAVLALAALSLTAAGCAPGKPSQPAAAPNSPAAAVAPPAVDAKYDSCLLLTKNDAEAVLGMKVNEPLYNAAIAPDGNTVVSSCHYATSAKDPSDVRVVSLLIRKAPDVATALSVYLETRGLSKGLSSVEPVDVPNLGDRAYWAAGRLNQLNVLVGDIWLIVNVQDNTNNNTLAQATEAAKRVLAKMK